MKDEMRECCQATSSDNSKTYKKKKKRKKTIQKIFNLFPF